MAAVKSTEARLKAAARKTSVVSQAGVPIPANSEDRIQISPELLQDVVDDVDGNKYTWAAFKSSEVATTFLFWLYMEMVKYRRIHLYTPFAGLAPDRQGDMVRQRITRNTSFQRMSAAGYRDLMRRAVGRDVADNMRYMAECFGSFIHRRIVDAPQPCSLLGILECKEFKPRFTQDTIDDHTNDIWNNIQRLLEENNNG